MPHATMPSPGLQAFILCGPGESLSTFTSTPKDFSKALIPIANRPMVWYPLDWCYRMGIHDITLVTPPESKHGLESALATNPALTSLPSPRPEILAPSDLTQTSGTGELLRLPEVQKAVTTDFVILPCDLISELEGSKIIQQWITLNSLSVTERGKKRKGGLGVFYPTYGLEGISQKKDETDFIATTPLAKASVPPPHGSLRSDIETLVMSMPTDTLNDRIEDDKDTFKIRASLSHKYGRVKFRRMHRDAHVYIFPKWVKDFAARNAKFDAISEDVMGWWAKAQWQTVLAEKLGMHEALSQKPFSSDDMTESGILEDESVDAAQLSSTKVAIPVQRASTASFASRVRTPAPTIPDALEVPPLLAYIQPNPKSTTPTADQPLIRRVDTSLALLSISLYLAKQPPTHTLAHEHKIHPTANLGQQSRISQEDSLVAENVKIGFRSVIKESVIGANCEIGNNVRLTRCLLMDGVTVGDGVQLTGCIVGRRARLEGMKPAAVPAEGSSDAQGEKKKGKKAVGADDEDDRTRLTDCEVAPNFHVEAGTEAKGEKMMAFDTEDLEDLGEDEDEDEEDE
ncbi:related to eukaryotic translation initiation factor subunit eIF2B-gamma [Lecanosticta acicola]|uniref:Translation initiation factor eIF2B subunit gamma n=1 Tax=Lecanosticta acicola TaxID=111012 RepID=A0AAI9EBB2_9PEZI|nr:related to eukaryotic translation initiation factor subunit eIF2B-gamma [Lecanosticta acicola]